MIQYNHHVVRSSGSMTDHLRIHELTKTHKINQSTSTYSDRTTQHIDRQKNSSDSLTVSHYNIVNSKLSLCYLPMNCSTVDMSHHATSSSSIDVLLAWQ